MSRNYFLCKLVDHINDLCLVFDEIYLASSGTIINEHEVKKMAQMR